MRYFRNIFERFLVWLGRNRFVQPTTLGDGAHNCALVSMYWTAPHLSESQISEAFGFCAEKWPYGGVSNKEFAIALKFLKVNNTYCDRRETLGELLNRRPARCVALLHGHFVAILNGRVVDHDRYLTEYPNATVYCHWLIH